MNIEQLIHELSEMRDKTAGDVRVIIQHARGDTDIDYVEFRLNEIILHPKDKLYDWL